MDDTMRLSCPKCRAIDWSHDEFTMAVDINGEIHRVRVPRAHPGDAGAHWHCERCGFRPAPGSDLVHHLREMHFAHVDGHRDERRPGAVTTSNLL
jgi:hypothetical protein